MKILSRKQIEELISIPEIIEAIEQGFVAYSRGETVIPPVGSLHFEHPPGECHIKYGYGKKGRYYVVKIASGFPENPKVGLPSCNGLMLLFDKQTGKPVSILLDEGYLTDVRTAVAGCIAARCLAPQHVSCVGIVGTGAQSLYQLKFLKHATKCRKALVWGRDLAKAQALCAHPDLHGWDSQPAKTLDELTAECNLIVTTTSSSKPLLFARQIRPGTHITAMGADDLGKQELDPEIFARADRVVVDSQSQCCAFGDTAHAIQRGLVEPSKLIELGRVLVDRKLGRTSEDQITVCDLTGVAIQDLQIATAVFERSERI